jgi:hypothetical protein
MDKYTKYKKNSWLIMRTKKQQAYKNHSRHFTQQRVIAAQGGN